MVVDVLERVAREYHVAIEEPFASHPLSFFIRHSACEEIRGALGPLAREFHIEGSPGRGNWATVPWLAVFDPIVTTSAERGYYVVYLFHVAKPLVYLSLAQGTTAVRREFGRQTRPVLRRRAEMMRLRLPEFGAEFKTRSIDLGANSILPRDYEAGHVLGCTYDLNNAPTEATAIHDLQRLVHAYLRLTFRGGFEPSIEAADDDDHILLSESRKVIERRRYRLHRRIERSEFRGHNT